MKIVRSGRYLFLEIVCLGSAFFQYRLVFSCYLSDKYLKNGLIAAYARVPN